MTSRVCLPSPHDLEHTDQRPDKGIIYCLKIKYAFLSFLFMLIAIKAFSNEKFDKISNEMDFLEIVDGHTLSRPLIKLVVQNDGSITGKAAFRAVNGNWSWDNQLFCRTLFWGERDLGLNCQLVEYNGEIIRFTADEGTGAFADFTIEKN